MRQRRSTKGQPDKVTLLTGNFRPNRSRAENYPDLAGSFIKPGGMTKEADAIWDNKVSRFEERGIPIAGYESTLRIYCELEASINRKQSVSLDVPASFLNAHRGYASEFFETPASNIGPRGSGNKGNTFAGSGKKPGSIIRKKKS